MPKTEKELYFGELIAEDQRKQPVSPLFETDFDDDDEYGGFIAKDQRRRPYLPLVKDSDEDDEDGEFIAEDQRKLLVSPLFDTDYDEDVEDVQVPASEWSDSLLPEIEEELLVKDQWKQPYSPLLDTDTDDDDEDGELVAEDRRKLLVSPLFDTYSDDDDEDVQVPASEWSDSPLPETEEELLVSELIAEDQRKQPVSPLFETDFYDADEYGELIAEDQRKQPYSPLLDTDSDDDDEDGGLIAEDEWRRPFSPLLDKDFEDDDEDEDQRERPLSPLFDTDSDDDDENVQLSTSERSDTPMPDEELKDVQAYASVREDTPVPEAEEEPRVERSLRAVRDFDARLPCGQGKIFLDGPDAYVMWLKDDEKFLYRFPNEDTWAKTLNPNNIYGTSCIDEDHCYDDTSLFLPKVGEKDAGNYRCRVHYQGSSSVDYVINLRIVDPIDNPKLIDERGEKIVTPYVGPLTLGSNLTIICEVIITDPPTTVVWLRNGETVRRIVSDRPGLFRERLEIVDATRNELDAHYQCTATNADVTDAMTASVVVKMYLPPLKIEIRVNNNYDFEVGQPRVVDCVVVGCVPTPTINWYIGGKLVKASAHKELHDGNYTVSSLTLTASMRDNGKWLSCRVHNAYLPTVYEDNVTLHVGYRPVRSNDQIPTIGVVFGEPQTLTCTVLSSEIPSQFRWTFPDSRMINTDPVKIEGSLNSYSTRLSWVPQASDLGLLQCFAINQFGEQKEPCQYHIVQGGPPETPECSPSEDNNSSDIYNDMRKLFCQTGWDGGRPQTVHLRIEDNEGNLVHNDTDPRGNFTIPSFLGKAVNYTVKVFATNTWGQSTVRTLKLNYTKQNTEGNHLPLGLMMFGFAGLGALSAAVLSATTLLYVGGCFNPEDKENQGAVQPGTWWGKFRARPQSDSEPRDGPSFKRAFFSMPRYRHIRKRKRGRGRYSRSHKSTARLSPIPEANEESSSPSSAGESDWI